MASSRVAPSAGPVAALTGALAASLCEMGCRHTSESATTERLATAAATLRDRRDLLLSLADEDGAAVEAVQTAVDDGDDEQAAFRTATAVPVRIAEAASVVAEQAVVTADDGTPNARTDAVVGAMLARAAVASAATIVRANLEHLDDDGFASDVADRVDVAEADANVAVAEITGRDE